MDWVERIQKAIDYIEEHLTEKLDAESIEDHLGTYIFCQP